MMLRIQNSTITHKASTQAILLLHVWLNELSPMIWRRLLIRGDNTLEDLHYALQISFGWDDSHLNVFHIHSRDFSVYREGGNVAENACQFQLAEFLFRRNEKFLYEYDFHVPWQHIIRVEKILSFDETPYPICISGQGLAPPEDCGGYEGFSELQEANSLTDILNRSAKMLKCFLHDNKRPSQEEVLQIRRWLEPRKIDRLKINHRLRLYASGSSGWIEEELYEDSSSDSCKV